MLNYEIKNKSNFVNNKLTFIKTTKMKKGLILLVFGLLLFMPGSIIAKDGKKESQKIADNSPYDPYEDHYAKDKTSVYYNGKKIHKAHAESFQVLHDGYAKDKDFIYYQGVKIEDGVTRRLSHYKLEVLGNGYAKDYNNVYYRGIILEGAYPDSFQIFN